MKLSIYIAYSLIFTLIKKIFGVNKKKIVIFATHDQYLTGNMGYIKREIEKKDLGYKLCVYTKLSYRIKLSLLDNIRNIANSCIVMGYHLPTAGVVILDNVFVASAFFRFHPEAKIVQVWHSAGVFKKFGLHACKDEKEKKLQLRANKNLTHIVVDSHRYINIIAEAFGVDSKNVFPIGSPRTDFLFTIQNIEKAKVEFNQHFMKIINKKKILYAPTFREYELTRKRTNEVCQLNLDIELLKEHLEKDYVLMVRLHPKIKKQLDFNKTNDNFIIDVSNYSNLEHLLAGVDLLITDYSSICLEFAALMKPVIFYAYDLDKYNKYDRGFYFSYTSWVPGPVVYNSEQLIHAIINAKVDKSRQKEFINQLFDIQDGKATERLISLMHS